MTGGLVQDGRLLGDLDGAGSSGLFKRCAACQKLGRADHAPGDRGAGGTPRRPHHQEIDPPDMRCD